MTSKMLTDPATDTAMWRRLVALAHPDRAGDHDLFIWVTSLREAVCDGLKSSRDTGYGTPSTSPQPPPRASRGFGHGAARVVVNDADVADFGAITARALRLSRSRSIGEPHASVLGLLDSCPEAFDFPLRVQQERGATYKTLAAIAHVAGMTGVQRAGWYRVAESIPLTQRHAGHILSRLKEDGAA